MNNKNTAKQTRCMEEGEIAAKANMTIHNCPYEFDITARSAWLVGWENGGGNIKSGVVEKKGAVMSKTKPIFVATGRNGNTDEAVVIADDKDEAVLLLGKSSAFWTFDTIGWADETCCASDVISLVSLNIPSDDELRTVYQKAYDEHAGPPKFRHSCNFDKYHAAGLRAVNRLGAWCDPNRIQPIPIPHNAVCFFKDGDKWCCVFGDFIDLQQSPSGFGDTFDEALDNLNKDRAKVESVPDVRMDHGGAASVV